MPQSKGKYLKLQSPKGGRESPIASFGLMPADTAVFWSLGVFFDGNQAAVMCEDGRPARLRLAMAFNLPGAGKPLPFLLLHSVPERW
jgi:hypothetical protein